jgi:hypothetical protein
MVIGRRVLLLGGAAALAGCTTGGRTVWLPWNPPSPLPFTLPPDLLDDLAGLTQLAAATAARAGAWKLTATQVSTLQWFAAVVAEHRSVLASDDPGRRQRNPSPATPGRAASAPGSAAAAYKILRATLSTLAGGHRRRALVAEGEVALLWASLAAFSSALASHLSVGVARLGDDTTGVTPDLDATGRQLVLTRCREAVYGAELALAAPGLSGGERVAVERRIGAWRRLRDVVTDAERASGHPLPSTPVGYDVRPAGNRSAAWRLVAEIETAMQPVLGAWLAGTDDAADRRLATDALIGAARAGIAFGGPARRWPGWPTE